MTLSVQDAKNQIDAIFDTFRSAVSPGPSLIPHGITAGKLYEAWVLCDVLAHLRDVEGCQIELSEGTSVVLKGSPGPINPAYPYFRVEHPRLGTLGLWTDVEFTTLSYDQSRGPLTRGDYHELDLVLVPDGAVGRPAFTEIRLGVECKNTHFGKDLLRAALGVRRELSLLSEEQGTGFARWPTPEVPASPPSCFSVYSTGVAPGDFMSPATVFGVSFVHLALP